MPNFVINKNPQANGDHEVHNKTNGCSYMPNSENQINLGNHPSCHQAVADAKRRWPNIELTAATIAVNPVILLRNKGRSIYA